MDRTSKMDLFWEMLREDALGSGQEGRTQGGPASLMGRKMRAPADAGGKRMEIRSLMNIRMPKEASKAMMEAQDAYLREELEAKGVVPLAEIPAIDEQYGSRHRFAGRISVWQGDITRLQIGAIVNAANPQLLGCFVPCHRCIDNAIHSAAGIQLREECHRIMEQRRAKHGKGYEEPTGTATLTKGYNLPCDYVIHTVGPIVHGRLTQSLCGDLKNCYRKVLECCMAGQIRSVAFCCISTGEFHFPNDEAARIAVDTVVCFLEEHPDAMDRVVFNVFKEEDRMLYEDFIRKELG